MSGDRSKPGMTSVARYSLERRIADLANEVPVETPPANWVTGPDFDNFILSWLDLKEYYELNDDTVIGPEVISEFIRISRELRHIVVNSEQTPDTREHASEQLTGLELTVELTLWEATNNLYANSTTRLSRTTRL